MPSHSSKSIMQIDVSYEPHRSVISFCIIHDDVKYACDVAKRAMALMKQEEFILTTSLRPADTVWCSYDKPALNERYREGLHKKNLENIFRKVLKKCK